MKTVLFAFAAFLLTVSTAVAQSGYSVRPGDTLSVEVLEDPSLNRQVLVTPDGSISFPFAGSIRVRGATPDEISRRIAGAIASNFAAPPNVFVSVASLRPREPVTPRAPAADPTITVYFMGEVGSEGAREVSPGTTFLQALAQAGGLTNFAAEKRIQLRRTDPKTLRETVSTVDYRALQRGARLNQNVVLMEGDVILVPQRSLFE
ncbi:MAG: polysaccharide biosynthesis/export family protein [Pseudomonadota bacterium]